MELTNEEIMKMWIGASASDDDCLTEVRRMVYTTPNDGDLGATIRKFIEVQFGLSVPLILKGERVMVTHNYLEGAPEYEVIARGDSVRSLELKETSFTFLHGGDMMMIAKYDYENEKWIST